MLYSATYFDVLPVTLQILNLYFADSTCRRRKCVYLHFACNVLHILIAAIIFEAHINVEFL